MPKFLFRPKRENAVSLHHFLFCIHFILQFLISILKSIFYSTIFWETRSLGEIGQLVTIKSLFSIQISKVIQQKEYFWWSRAWKICILSSTQLRRIVPHPLNNGWDLKWRSHLNPWLFFSNNEGFWSLISTSHDAQWVKTFSKPSQVSA